VTFGKRSAIIAMILAVSYGSPSVIAEAIFSINKQKIISTSRAHIQVVKPEVKVATLRFRGFQYINRADNLGGDRLQADFCWGEPHRSKADMFDVLVTTKVERGFFKVISVEVTLGGEIENVNVRKMPLKGASKTEVCLQTRDN